MGECMKSSLVIRSVGATASLALVLTAVGVADASDFEHTTVVSTNPVDWTPDLVEVSGQPKPVAYSIAEAGNQMVVGGRFSRVEQNPGTTQYDRSNVVAFGATDGVINKTFAPNVNGEVWSVLSEGTSVYIGGNFTTVNGVASAAVAKLDLATGALDSSFKSPFKGGRVSDMAMQDGNLVLAGTFPRRLMSVNPNTGGVTNYIPTSLTVTGKLVGANNAPSDSPQVFKFDISSDGQHLVAVGNFTDVQGQPRPRVFMLDLTTAGATLSSWNYEPLAEPCTSTRRNAISYIQDVDFAPNSQWFALAAFGFMYQGYDLPINDAGNRRWYQICDAVARFETSSLNPTQPTWINYSGGDSIKSVAVTGAAVYVQGHSRWLENPYGRDFKNDGGKDRLGGGAISPNPGGYARAGDLHAVPSAALDWNPNMPQQSGGYQVLPTAAGVWFVTDGARFNGEYHRGIRFAPLP